MTRSPALLGVTKAMFSTKRIAIALIGSQVIVKYFIEFQEVSKLTTSLPIAPTAWLLQAGWLILLPLCLLGRREAFQAGAAWGVVNAVLAVAVPLVGICKHVVLGPAIGVQCILITVACHYAAKSCAGI